MPPLRRQQKLVARRVAVIRKLTFGSVQSVKVGGRKLKRHREFKQLLSYHWPDFIARA
jgi:hypothetical protein